MKVLSSQASYILIFTIFLSAPNVMGMDKQIEKGGFGFKAGLINSTTITIDTNKYESDVGLATGVYFDLPFIKKSKIVVAMDFYDIQILDDRQWMVDLSVGFRLVIRKIGSNVALKPGIAIGYAHLALIGDLNTTNYITIKTGVEIMYHADRAYVYTLEMFFLATRNGGNRTVDISNNPALVVRLGVLY